MKKYQASEQLNISEEYRKRIAEFISMYVDIEDKRYNYCHDTVIMQAIKLLINSGIFTVKELKLMLLKEKNIILNYDFIDKCLEVWEVIN